MQNKNVGYLITAPISAVKKIDCDEVWQITRSDKVLPEAIWVPALAPSWDLFNQHLHEWKDLPAEEWWPLYKDRFLRELQTDEKLIAMRRLWSLVNVGKVIALVCFCSDGAHCHRILVAEFLKKYGVNVVEFDDQHTSARDEDKDPVQMVLFSTV